MAPVALPHRCDRAGFSHGDGGWFVTEFGRQPWIVYEVLRTSEAATNAPALGPTFLIFFAIYIGLAVTTARLLLLQAKRNRAAA